MRHLLIVSALTIGLASCAVHEDNNSSEKSTRLIVSYSADSKEDILADARKSGMKVVYDLKNMNIIVLGVPEKDADKEINRLEQLTGVLGVQKDSSEVKPQ